MEKEPDWKQNQEPKQDLEPTNAPPPTTAQAAPKSSTMLFAIKAGVIILIVLTRLLGAGLSLVAGLFLFRSQNPQHRELGRFLLLAGVVVLGIHGLFFLADWTGLAPGTYGL